MNGFIESDDAFPINLKPVGLSPIQRAMERMRGTQRAWIKLNSDSRAGECIRIDVVRAVRAIGICERSSDEYLMIFGIGGPNPCRADPVELPTWESFT